MSNLSVATTNVKGEASDSNSTAHYPCPHKRARHDSNAYTSRFKGVVALQNGHWGAQIYANYQRIWLGTFKSENEAARAYDSAAINIRNWDSHRNFPWTSITAHEPKFQSQYSTEVILYMIKDGSYPSKFADYLKLQYPSRELEVGLNFSLVHWKGEYLCTLLFEKALTPSDVGKLNRLVIPKKHALNYFPVIDSSAEGNECGGQVNDVQLVFYERSMRPWKFRYCYWKSSQSYVFTRGWNEFVREKKLNWKDSVIFSKCEYMDASNTIRKFCMIDLAYYKNKAEEICVDVGENVVFGAEEIESEEGVQNPENVLNSDEIEGEKNNLAVKDLVEFESANSHNKGLKLFGVQII